MTISNKTIGVFRDSLLFFSKEFKGTRVIIGKVANIGRAEDYSIHSVENFSDELFASIEEFRNELSFSLIEKKNIQDIHTCYCGTAMGKHFIVSKDGTIKTCSHLDVDGEFVVGHIIDDVFSIDTNRVAYLQQKYVVCNRSRCGECIAKYYCAGGCPSNEKYSYEDYISACELQKRIFVNRMEERLRSNSQHV